MVLNALCLCVPGGHHITLDTTSHFVTHSESGIQLGCVSQVMARFGVLLRLTLAKLTKPRCQLLGPMGAQAKAFSQETDHALPLSTIFSSSLESSAEMVISRSLVSGLA